jgi:hypothetical protein
MWQKKLIINQDGEILAKFIPVGLLIIGAEGRVDLVGKSGKEIFVYFVITDLIPVQLQRDKREPLPPFYLLP